MARGPGPVGYSFINSAMTSGLARSDLKFSSTKLPAEEIPCAARLNRVALRGGLARNALTCLLKASMLSSSGRVSGCIRVLNRFSR